MDYEKKYKEILEWARKNKARLNGVPIEDVLPELAESEDERIRKDIINFIYWLKGNPSLCSQYYKDRYDDMLAWLEKQKENPKTADSIPSNCVSDAKCEDRWHKVADFLPDSGRDVLAKDALGNYLLASFDGDQWFVNVYDGEDKPIVYTPAIKEWCDIPSEKQKEQKPYEPHNWPADKDNLTQEQKPVEWTEDDEAHMKWLCRIIHSRKVHGELSLEEESELGQWIDRWINHNPQPKWDEFDEDCLKRSIWYVENPAPSVIKDSQLALWLNMLRSRFFLKPQTKLEWSEEDEEMRNLIVAIFEVNHPNGFFKANELGTTDMHGVHTEEIISWLKFLPLNLKKKNEDVAKLCSNEWSKEDEEMLVRLLDSISIGNDYKEMRNWLLPKLKSLRPVKQEWTEDEKQKLNRIYSIIGWAMDEHAFSSCKKLIGDKEGVELQDFLRSISKPEQLPHWKPTEKDLMMLEHIIGQYETGNKNSKVMGYLPRIEELNFLKKILDVWKN